MLKKEKGERMKKTKPISVAMLIAFVLSIFAIFPTAYAAGTISLTPSSNVYDTDTAYVGMKFNVTASCSGVDQSILGAQITLHFNDTILNVTQWWAPYWDSSFFMPSPYVTIPTPPDAGYIHVGAGHGYIKISVAKGGLPPAAPWGHNGTIAIIEFEITAIPGKLGELNCTLDINNVDTYLKNPSNVDIPVTKNNGWYELSWTTPDPAHMGVQPTLTEYGPYPPSAIGEYFVIGVYIEDLAEAWGLTTAAFNLTYNATVIDVLGDAANVTWAPIWGAQSITFVRDVDPAVLDYMNINVSNPSATPKNDELVANITFTVLMQSDTPPRPVGYYDGSPLDFSDVALYDHIGPVTTDASSNGEVKIYALMTLPLGLFEVVPSSVVLGPEPSIGEEFDVDIVLTGPTVEGLSFAWYLVGVQFRLTYCDDLLEVVSITEGPFLKDGPWNLHGTFFIGMDQTNGLGPHVMVGEMLLPNGMGIYDQTSWPNGTGTVATIRFRAIKQECPDPFTCALDLMPLFPGCWAIDRDGLYIPIDEASIVNGTYTMLPFDMPGSVVDVFGGASNGGLWTGYDDPFIAPWGGQGEDHWMDLVFPQSEITLYAELTHNYWPVQSKEVGFEIEGPFEKDGEGGFVPKEPGYKIWLKITKITDENGTAKLVFRMPWPCDDPENLTGIWLVTVSARVGDTVVMDTMPFYYEYLVNWVKVTVDPYYYIHGDTVCVVVEYQTHSVQNYTALFAIVLMDDLGVPVWMELVNATVGGAEWCEWKPGDFTICFEIPKWAAAGYAYIHVSVYNKDPTDGGFAYCPEYDPVEIQIGPY
jgi:hypothetical protein